MSAARAKVEEALAAYAEAVGEMREPHDTPLMECRPNLERTEAALRASVDALVAETVEECARRIDALDEFAPAAGLYDSDDVSTVVKKACAAAVRASLAKPGLGGA